MLEWISGTRNKAATCLSRLVKLPNDDKATGTMLTTTNLNVPAFNTRSQTSQQHQTTMGMRQSNTPSIMNPPTSDLTQWKPIQILHKNT